MAHFYPFLAAESARFPELALNEYRISSYVGSPVNDEMISGPALDTARLEDVQSILMLLGVPFEALLPISSSDDRGNCGIWLGFDPILAITEPIVFAVEDPAARNFLLDLKAAGRMMVDILPESGGGAAGCMLHVVLPGNVH